MRRWLVSSVASVLAVVLGVRVAAWLLEPVFGPVVVVLVTVLTLLLLWSYLGRF